ncbi:MAG: M48 family metalloprotease [Methylobacter sp.]|nr:M48 family metalloprotease [Methylobacter sp.]
MNPRIEEDKFNLDSLSSSTTLRFYMISTVVIFTAYQLGDELRTVISNFNPDIGGNSVLGFYMMILLICLSAVIYWLMPMILIRRYHLTLVPYDQFHDLLTRINELASKLGVPFPSVYFAPIVRRQNAQVFGFEWKPQLRIDKGLTLLFARRTDRFDAVILHELAHIQHGDVFNAYAAMALIWATLILTVSVAVTRDYYYFHYLLSINYEWIRRVPITDTAIWILKTVGALLLDFGKYLPLLCLLFIEYARLIRIREHYADWRAGQHGVNETLINMFSQYQQILTSVWKRFIHSHPSPSERASFLQQPLTLGCQISMGDILLIGALMVILQNSVNVTGELNSAVGFHFNPKDLSDFEQQVSRIPLSLWVAGVLPLLVTNTVVAITWSQIMIRYSFGSWLSGRSSTQQIMGAFPILAYSFLGVVIGYFINPKILVSLSRAEPLDLVRLSYELIYVPVFFLISSIYFPLIVPLIAPWTQGEHRPFGLAIISAIMVYVINSSALGLSMSIQGLLGWQRLTGSMDVPFLLMLFSMMIWLFMLFLLARFLLKRGRQLGKLGQVPIWACVKSTT